MSMIMQLEASSNQSGSTQRSCSNDVMISLSDLRKLEKQIEDLTHEIRDILGPKLKEMECRVLEGSSNQSGSTQRSRSNDMMISSSDLRKLGKQIEELTHEIRDILGPKLKEMEGRVKKLEQDVVKLSASMPTSRPRRLYLQFSNKISSPMLTGQEIKDKGGDYMEVALVDDTGNVVDSGPEASARVKIVAFKGDSGENEGDAKRITDFIGGIPGEKCEKRSILVGDVQLNLNEGTGLLSNIKFRSSSTHSSGVFKLVAQIVDSFDGIEVKEANTESFTVNDYRKKYKEKHYPPSLSDHTWRLDNIARGGPIDKRLKMKEVNSVEHFLIQLLKDSETLKNVVNLPPKKWETTVNHARTCRIDKRIYCSMGSHEKKAVFNVLGQVLALILESKYVPFHKLSEGDKADASKMVAAAFKHQEKPLEFADEASLRQQLPPRLAAVNSLDYLGQERTFDHEVEASEISEYEHTNLNASSEVISSSSDSTCDNSVKSGDTNSAYEVEITNSSRAPESGFNWPIGSPGQWLDWSQLLSSFDEYNLLFPARPAESHEDYLSSRADFIIDSSTVSDPRVRGRMVLLLSISKLLMQFERVVAFERTNNRKRQRVL